MLRHLYILHKEVLHLIWFGNHIILWTKNYANNAVFLHSYALIIIIALYCLVNKFLHTHFDI